MNCDIIQDLLPLYHDGVCSEGSRAAVKEHLTACEDCRRLLEDMDMPLPEEKRAKAANDAAAVKRISQEWKKSKWRARVKGAAVAAAVCLVLVGTWVAATALYIFPVETEKIQITNMRQLSDGRILYHFYIDDDLTLRVVHFEYGEDGDMYYVPKRAFYTAKRQSPSPADSDQELYLPEINAWARANGVEREITRVWYGRGEDAILLWEEGMELPAASAADEAEWGFVGESAGYWDERYR